MVLAALLIIPLIPVSFAAENVYNELPDGMDPLWRSYFESADFDGDGVTYPYDHYLGRDDTTVDYAAKSGGSLMMGLGDSTTFDPLDLDISITSNRLQNSSIRSYSWSRALIQ